MLENKKFIYSILGAILLSLLSNVVWELVRPIILLLFKLILNVSTLGVESFKSSLYQEIARGLHEGVSLQMYQMLQGVFLGILSVALLIFYKRKKMKSSENNVNEEQLSNSRKSYIVWFAVIYCVLCMTILVIEVVRQTYINKSVTYFKQLSSIVDPYIDDQEEELYLSRFSQIKNRSDFVHIINDLQVIVKSNKLTSPEFDFTF